MVWFVQFMIMMLQALRVAQARPGWSRSGPVAAARPRGGRASRVELEPESLLLIAVNGQHATNYKGRLH
jgi:hypothetical protein